ncbi:MAG: tetratricopeptide repeat protein [Acidobacteriota bacterium]
MKIRNLLLMTTMPLVMSGTAVAESKPERFYLSEQVPPSEGKVDRRIGRLEFSNQDPSKESMQTPQDAMEFQGARILYISGKVMMEDGTPPPEAMTVDLACNGQVFQQVLTRSKGQFHFELGNRNAFSAIGAVVRGPNTVTLGQTGNSIRSRGLGRYDLTGCNLRLAPLLGYASNTISLGFRGIFDKPNVGNIILQRRQDVEGTTVSLNALSAPKKAKKAYRNARKELGKKKPKLDKAAQELDKAVAAFPKFASAWHLMGQVRLRSQDTDGARQAFHNSIEADPNFLSPYIALARMEVESSNWTQALGLTTRLVKLDPYLPISQYYHGVTTFYSGQLEQSADYLGRLKKSGQAKNFPATHYLLGSIHKQQGDIPSAAREYQLYLERSRADEELKDKIRRQLSQWEKEGLIQLASEGSGK